MKTSKQITIKAGLAEKLKYAYDGKVPSYSTAIEELYEKISRLTDENIGLFFENRDLQARRKK